MKEILFRGLLDFLKERKIHVGRDPYQYAYVRALVDACPDSSFGEPTSSRNSVFLDAPAGTGKTTLAVLTGAYMVEKEIFDRLVYLRTEDDVSAGKDRGAIPGDDNDKFAPYRAPFVEALDLVRPGLWEEWSLDGLEAQREGRPLSRLGIKAIATHPGYIRGKTRSRCFVILDEAQNWRMGQLQAVYTRFRNDCAVVTIGHSGQCDIPKHKQERVAGLLPFQVYAIHHHKRGAWVGTLVNNYRGEFAQWSDQVRETVDELAKKEGGTVFSELLLRHDAGVAEQDGADQADMLTRVRVWLNKWETLQAQGCSPEQLQKKLGLPVEDEVDVLFKLTREDIENFKGR